MSLIPEFFLSPSVLVTQKPFSQLNSQFIFHRSQKKKIVGLNACRGINSATSCVLKVSKLLLTKFSLFFFPFFQINPDGLFRLTSLDRETLELKIKGKKKKSLRGPTQGFLHFPAREKKL